MTNNISILVAPCQLSGQVKSDVTTAFESLLNEGYAFKISDTLNTAHLLVIDVDNEAGRKQAENSKPGQVKLLISSNIESGKNIISIQKPVNIQVMIKVLYKLYTVMHAHLAKIKSACESDSTGYPVTDSVFYSLLQAKKLQQSLHVISPGSEIFVDGHNQTIRIDGNLNDLRKLFYLQYPEIEFRVIDPVLIEKNNSLQVIALHNALWTAAITCSSGRLLPELDINTPIKLRAWPSFTRNDFKPEHLKLAALLAQKPISLADMGKQTNIPYSDIVDFYNAAYAVDLIDQNANQQIEPAQQSPTKKSVIKNTLLNKIAARLGFNQRAYGTYYG